VESAFSEDLVALFQIVEKSLMLFGLFLLRPDEKKIKYHKDEDEWEKLAKRPKPPGPTGSPFGRESNSCHNGPSKDETDICKNPLCFGRSFYTRTRTPFK
jgi:hypothetical protein